MFDQVLPHQVKVQYAAEMNFALQRPDSLMVDYHSDLGGKQLWYQGDMLTIFDQPHAVYASMKVPTSIDAMLDEVTQTGAPDAAAIEPGVQRSVRGNCAKRSFTAVTSG